jgi:DNA replication protein DnaC
LPRRSAIRPVAPIALCSISARRGCSPISLWPAATVATPRILRSLGRVDRLILDDWGLEPLDAAARHDVLEILEDRYGSRSTIVTSQLPVDQWHALIGYADAVLDRLVHNAHRIDLNGESMQRTRKPGRKA